MRQLMLFTFSGTIATAVHYAILVVLVDGTYAGPVTASSIGAVAGALSNYGLNRRYTFRSRRTHGEALPRYLITAAAGMGLNGAVMAVLVGARAHYLVAQTAATGLVFLWNFFVNRWWTFRGEDYAR